MLEHLDELNAADRLMRAIEAPCRAGILTRDVGGTASTSAVGDAVADRLGG
jgi:tartrate dehydrogenase/decarboxylase/D-malate dehydrogenase